MQPSPLDAADLTWLAGLARALLGEANAADDLVQDTAIAALRGGLPHGPGRRSWLAAVARRLAARRFRGESRRKRREARAAREEALPDAGELVERAETAEQVVAAVRSLPEPFRHTVLLRFLEGLTPEEVAQEVGKPADTVRWRLRRGLELLRSELVRRHDRDWSSWCVLLLPLSRSIQSGGAAAATGAQATTVGSPTTPVAASLTKTGGGLVQGLGVVLAKVALVTACVVGLVGLWTARDGASRERQAEVALQVVPPARATEASLDRLSALERVAPGDEREMLVLAEPEELKARESIVSAFEGLLGRVVDPDGQPVRGALVFARRAGEDELVGRVVTNAQGVFRIPLASQEEADGPLQGAVPMDLGVSANGYLRAFLPDVRGARSFSESTRTSGSNGGNGGRDDASGDMLLVRLQRGGSLSGWVVDEAGLPVQGLRMLAHSASAGITHVSPSKMSMRAEKWRTAGEASRYEQCLVVTDDEGAVRFTGLDPEEGVVLCVLDPGWRLRDARPGGGGGTGLVWVAERWLGVRVRVVDAESGRLVDPVSGTFGVALTFDDGEELDISQWVGRGSGELTWTLDGEMAPQLIGRVVTRARFYGTVRRDGEEDVQAQAWQAPLLEDPLGVKEIATVRVRLAPSKPVVPDPSQVVAEQALEEQVLERERGKALVELDVRFSDGTPYDGELNVSWASRFEGRSVTGEAELEPSARGLYLVDVPAGEVVLEARPDMDSGTMSPWSGRWSLRAGEVVVPQVVLPRGARATLLRPVGWTGEWFVRVSWRSSEDEDWFGSWWHSTEEGELVLDVLQPAIWRFEVRRTDRSSETPLVWTAELEAGEARVVGE